MTILDIQRLWKDTPVFHQGVADAITKSMRPELHIYRDWIEKSSYGYGERCMYGMWDMLYASLPGPIVKYVEIGVHRGATMALMGIIASFYPDKTPSIFGISPMNGHPDYIKRDYPADLKNLWGYFNIKHPYIILEGFSSDPNLIMEAFDLIIPKSVDLLYIDGSHDFKDVLMDLIVYCNIFLRPGGYLVMDDAACDLQLPGNWFPGHQEVTNALNKYYSKEHSLEFIASVAHNKIYRLRPQLFLNAIVSNASDQCG